MKISELDEPSFAKEYLNYLLVVKNLATRTVFNYHVQLRMFLKWIDERNGAAAPSPFHVSFDDFASITTQDIYEYLSFSKTVLDNQSAARALKLTSIKRAYDYFCRVMGRMGEDPARDIPAPKEEKKLPKYLTPSECKSLLDSIQNSKDEEKERNYCLVLWLLTCGFRLSEMVGANISDIRETSITIRGKGRKERCIYLNASCVQALDDYIQKRKTYLKIIDSDALWISKRTGKRLTGRRLEQIVEALLLQAGLNGKGISPHKLRHTAATLLYQSGNASILEIKEILGHENIATTEVYTHLNPLQIKDALDNSPIASMTAEKNEKQTDV